jgi:glycosyltransferase involved in cell wall biosynthesis
MYKEHTFAICAYKESEYLEECIKSLKRQTIKSNIIMATSTPNEYVSGLCEKYGIPLYINEGEKGITNDWNFAYSKANTRYITIAHQDDVYHKKYFETFLKTIEKEKKPLIFFTDYFEIRDNKVVKSNKLLKIKRILLLPLRIKAFKNSRFFRRRILSMGSSICCPSVTFDSHNVMNPVFLNNFRTNEDWEAWERISKLKGAFLYCSKPLTYHRIHGGSETSAAIAETGRSSEDYIMFRKFWPSPIAKILTKAYGTSEKSNKM